MLRNTSVKRVVIDGESHAGNSVDLRTRKAKNLEIVFGPCTARITGRVTNETHRVPALTLVLINEADQETVRLEGAPAGGQFEMKSLAPGEYRFYAVEDFDQEAWASKDFRALLVSKSTLIDLRDGANVAVSLPLISSNESQAAVQKVTN